MRWFFTCGAVGLIVAVALALWSAHGIVRPVVLLTLWPSSIAGMANTGPFRPSLPGLLILAFMYGGNFLLYGALGTAAKYLVSRKTSNS